MLSPRPARGGSPQRLQGLEETKAVEKDEGGWRAVCALGCGQNPQAFNMEFTGVSSPRHRAEMSEGGYPPPGTLGTAVTHAGEPPATQVTQAPVTSPPRRAEAPPRQSARSGGGGGAEV